MKSKQNLKMRMTRSLVVPSVPQSGFEANVQWNYGDVDKSGPDRSFTIFFQKNGERPVWPRFISGACLPTFHVQHNVPVHFTHAENLQLLRLVSTSCFQIELMGMERTDDP